MSPLQRNEEPSPALDHELCAVLRACGYSLNATLVEMLNEHFSHCTERRGCGFTQASRHLAELVNRPREQQLQTAAKLFSEWPRRDLASLLEVLRALPERLERQESRLLAAIMLDLVLPAAGTAVAGELPPCFDELKVGTCPLAEKYFLEIGHGFVRRRGRVNVLVSQQGEPLLIEKLNLGDNHSCISVAELRLNGVRLPPGCLFAVRRDEDAELRANANLPGLVIPVQRCQGFRFLRLTTLAVAPQYRQRAFSAHFQAQVDAGLFSPGQATIEQLRRVAQEQL